MFGGCIGVSHCCVVRKLFVVANLKDGFMFGAKTKVAAFVTSLSLVSLDLILLVLFLTSPGRAQSVAGGILLSSSNDRSLPVPLESAVIRGDVFIFVPEAPGISEVRFFLDVTAGSVPPLRIERVAPYDLAGTFSSVESGFVALPFDSRNLPNGDHYVEAQVLYSDGSSLLLRGDFEVDNSDVEGPLAELRLSDFASRDSSRLLDG